MNITPDTAHGFNTMVETMQAAGHNMTLGMMEIDYPWPFGQTLIKNTSAYRLMVGLVGQRYSKILTQNLKYVLEGLKLNTKTKQVIITGDTKCGIVPKGYKKSWKNVEIEPNDIINQTLAILTVLNTIPKEEIYYVKFHLQTGNLQGGEIRGHFDYAHIDRIAETITWYHFTDDIHETSDDDTNTSAVTYNTNK